MDDYKSAVLSPGTTNVDHKDSVSASQQFAVKPTSQHLRKAFDVPTAIIPQTSSAQDRIGVERSNTVPDNNLAYRTTNTDGALVSPPKTAGEMPFYY